jgi:hypothetical protein
MEFTLLKMFKRDSVATDASFECNQVFGIVTSDFWFSL